MASRAQVRELTAEEILSGVSLPAEDILASPAQTVSTQEPGFLDVLREVPGQVGRYLLSGGPTAGFQPQFLAQQAEDRLKADQGDPEAKARIEARGILASSVGALVPGGAGIAGRAALGALGGAIGGGLDAGARGEEIGPAAGSGALVGGVLGGTLGAAGQVAKRLVRLGKPVPKKLADAVRVEASRAADPAAGLDPVKRLTDSLKQVPDLRPEQKRLTRIGRARQIAAFEKAGEGLTGEARAMAKLKAMSGPLEKVDFGALRPLLNQADVDALFQIAETSPLIAGFERARAASILRQLFKPEGVTIPAPAELKLLERLFGSDLVQTLVEKQHALGKWERIGRPLINSSREMMATADLSAPLRQGLLLGAGHPKEFVSAFGSMFKYAASPKNLRDLEINIVQRDTFELMQRGKLALTKAGSVLGDQEERFGGSFARRIPGLKGIIEGSERGYTGFLNKLRADVFDSMIKDAANMGVPLTDDALKDIAGFINAASGRGNLPEKLLPHAQTGNVLFFSPRLLAGRLQTLNPMLYVKGNAVVRKHAIRSMLSLGALTTTTLSLAALAGAEVETDMTSSDFAKIKLGNTRYDILGGFQQYAVLGARLLQAVVEEEGTDKGKATGVAGLNFFRNKLAPIPSLLADISFPRRGEVRLLPNIEEAELGEVMKRFTPMVMQDAIETMKEMGWIGLPMAAPAVFGVGVQVYD